MRHGKTAGLALALGLSLGGATADKMLVEEPGTAAQPVDPETEAGRWKDNPALSAEEKAADIQRRRKMQEMVRAIQEKRKALEMAGSQERPQRAQELQELMLAEPIDDAEKKAAREEAKVERREETRQKQLEKKLEKQEKKQEKEKKNPGKGNSKG